MGEKTYPKFYLYRRIVQAKSFIDNNYADRIDIDCISDAAFFSKFHFIRVFKSIYGKTPHQYLISVRVEKATQSLKEGVSVNDVCTSVGFESHASFSTLFKKIVGETPSTFRSRHQDLNKKIQQNPIAFVPACFAHKNGWS